MTNYEVRIALEEIMADLEDLALSLEPPHDEMGHYLIDMALEECREAIWRLSQPPPF